MCNIRLDVYLQSCGPLEEEGMVMAVLDRAFDVLVLKLGVVKRVYCEVSSYAYSFNLKLRYVTLGTSP